MAYTYILVDFVTVVVCFMFSFHPRIQFNKQFSAFIKASILVAIPFILWDIWFTKSGVWWFNDSYLIGFRIGGLPIEEWLFFICIPFACVFTYFCLDKFFHLNWANKFGKTVAIFTIVVCLLAAVMYSDQIYTLITAVATAATVGYLQFVAKVDWLGKSSLVFLILMLGFFPVNGVLTGTGLASPIVNYNSSEILNIRVLTIPVEDMVYGYTQFLLNIYFFKLFQKTSSL